tara:strand:- start:8400 stop:8585 length:186 start_codon:yes stop_codon:yes gene_type:complete
MEQKITTQTVADWIDIDDPDDLCRNPHTALCSLVAELVNKRVDVEKVREELHRHNKMMGEN